MPGQTVTTSRWRIDERAPKHPDRLQHTLSKDKVTALDEFGEALLKSRAERSAETEPHHLVTLQEHPAALTYQPWAGVHQKAPAPPPVEKKQVIF
ncbi:hypothetical protein TcWFU_005940 [Taenia crassiceps]|uniref:Uncharacterized protein n=1 Tax=Taenia crassiceps TaxID=6207 RepID=A0ABR4QRQ3_9CEST